MCRKEQSVPVGDRAEGNVEAEVSRGQGRDNSFISRPSWAVEHEDRANGNIVLGVDILAGRIGQFRTCFVIVAAYSSESDSIVIVDIGVRPVK
jgi:hypothetical protein